jgi:hypothetical protein
VGGGINHYKSSEKDRYVIEMCEIRYGYGGRECEICEIERCEIRYVRLDM